MADTMTPSGEAQTAVHPLKKSYMFISSKHVDMNDLTYLEAASMTLALVLAVTIGVINSTAILG
jgi:hypothetical protein